MKGMTCDSLLLILNANSLGQNLSIENIRPAEGFPTEKQRMIYVALSRPRYLLSIGVPEAVSVESIYRTLGDDVEII